jgi:HK97 family phage major capsid protein/HK97 family phage prohead protease
VATTTLPSYIERIVRHLRAKGMSEQHAIAVAVNTCRLFCRTGDSNLPGHQQINAGSRAEACSALAQWEAGKVAGARVERVSEQPFDSSAARFTDAQWQRACVLDRGPQIESVKERYALPIREPDGALNVLAMHEATRRITTLRGVAAKAIRAAARRLVAAFRRAGLEPPQQLLEVAGMAAEAAEQRDLVEERSAPDVLSVEGRKLRGIIPFGVESRDMGGFREVMRPGCLANADLSDLVATVDHAGLPLGRYPSTLTIEQRDDGLHWSVELPKSRSDVRELVERGDLSASSWRMVVAQDSWDGDLRTVEEVRALKDVAVVTTSAYPSTAAFAELRSQPVPRPPKQQEEPMEVVEEAEIEEEVEVEERAAPSERGGGLTVEERTITPEQATDVEERIHELIRATAKGEARSLTLASGDAITPPQLSSYLWDRLRPQSVALRSGIRVIPTDRKTIQWPRVISDPVPEWVGETEVIPATDPAFDTLEADPKKLAARTEFSNEVLDDSEPEAEGVVRRLMQRALALKLDLGFFQGNPAADDDSIRGLKFVAGIQTGPSLGANGAAIPAGAAGLNLITDAVGMLEDADVPGPFAIVMRPSVWRQFTKLVDSQGHRLLGDFSRETPPNIDGHRVYTSNQLAANETQGTSNDTSSIYIYSTDPDTGPALVRRKDVQIEIDRSRLFDKDMSEMRGKTRVDLLVPQPLAVLRITGVRPA